MIIIIYRKRKTKAAGTGEKLLDKVEEKFDNTMDQMINKKLLEKVDTTFDNAVDSFIDNTYDIFIVFV